MSLVTVVACIALVSLAAGKEKSYRVTDFAGRYHHTAQGRTRSLAYPDGWEYLQVPKDGGEPKPLEYQVKNPSCMPNAFATTTKDDCVSVGGNMKQGVDNGVLRPSMKSNVAVRLTFPQRFPTVSLNVTLKKGQNNNNQVELLRSGGEVTVLKVMDTLGTEQLKIDDIEVGDSVQVVVSTPTPSGLETKIDFSVFTSCENQCTDAFCRAGYNAGCLTPQERLAAQGANCDAQTEKCKSMRATCDSLKDICTEGDGTECQAKHASCLTVLKFCEQNVETCKNMFNDMKRKFDAAPASASKPSQEAAGEEKVEVTEAKEEL